MSSGWKYGVSVGIALFSVSLVTAYVANQFAKSRRQMPRSKVAELSDEVRADPEDDTAERLLMDEEERQIND